MSTCKAWKHNPGSRGKAQTCFIVLHLSWSWMQMQHVGAAVTVDAVCVSQLQSSCPVCCGGGCSTWGHGCGLHTCGIGLWSPSIWCVCCSRSLCAVCVVVMGAVDGVAVAVFLSSSTHFDLVSRISGWGSILLRGHQYK
jgi:hypothetical protein